MTEAGGEEREKLRNRFGARTSSPLPPPPEIPDVDSNDADLDAILRTLDVLSTAADLPPSSDVELPSTEETKLHAFKMKLVSQLSQAGESERFLSLGFEDQKTELLRYFDTAIQREAERSRMTLGRSQRGALAQTLIDEVLGCGPIEPLLRDPQVSEVMVNGPRVVWVERRGKLERTNVRFFNDEHVMYVLARIAQRLGRSIDYSQPYLDARLPDGSRVHAIIPPLAIDGSTVTIRKFKAESLQMEDLVTFGSLTPEAAFFLGACVKARLNIVVSGGTGTGKTTMLNILSRLVQSNQRIVTIEDAAELKVRESHPHVVRLETRPATSNREAVTIRELVRNALRMRPDRIIVGECRGGEALDMLQAMNTGHDGSMTTAHANASEELIQRVETMCLMAGVELPAAAIRRQIASALDLIVQIRRYPDGSRKVAEIVEVAGYSNDQVVLKPIFTYEMTETEKDGTVRGQFRVAAEPPRFLPKFQAEGISFPMEIFHPTAS